MNKEEIRKLIEEDNCKNYFLINELLAIRDKRKETQDYTIYVDGYISIDVINQTIALENKVKELENEKIELNITRDKLLEDTTKENIKLKKRIEELEESSKENYWKGYIQKQNEAVEICKICKYKTKLDKLEKREQKVNEILEKACKLYENGEIYDTEEVLNIFLEELDT